MRGRVEGSVVASDRKKKELLHSNKFFLPRSGGFFETVHVCSESEIESGEFIPSRKDSVFCQIIVRTARRERRGDHSRTTGGSRRFDSAGVCRMRMWFDG